MAINSGGLGVIEHGLIRNRDSEDLFEDSGRFSGGDGKGDVESERQSEHIRRIVNTKEIDVGIIGFGMLQLFVVELIFSELITQFKLRGFGFSQLFFFCVEIV